MLFLIVLLMLMLLVMVVLIVSRVLLDSFFVVIRGIFKEVCFLGFLVNLYEMLFDLRLWNKDY